PSPHSRKAKITSRLMTDASGSQFIKFARPRVEKDEAEMRITDYEMTRYCLGKLGPEGHIHNFEQSVARLVAQTRESEATKEQLQNQIHTLTSYVQTFLDPNAPPLTLFELIVPLSKVDSHAAQEFKKMGRMGKMKNEWIDSIIQKGCELLPEMVRIFKIATLSTEN
ncbi:hypothetical protein KI387_007850, partial [Taxus chinensis]